MPLNEVFYYTQVTIQQKVTDASRYCLTRIGVEGQKVLLLIILVFYLCRNIGVPSTTTRFDPDGVGSTRGVPELRMLSPASRERGPKSGGHGPPDSA